MLLLDSEQTHRLAGMPELIECLRHAFRSPCVAPARQVAHIPGGAGERLFVSMPAFDTQGRGAVKLLTIVPENPARGLPTIQGMIAVFSEQGTPVAILDGTAVTRLRTGAASALASDYLSRHDSSHLLIVGSGALAPYMAMAHCTVRPIRRVSVWGRRPERVAATVAAIRSRVAVDISVDSADSIERSAATADIVCCATSSATALLCGRWLKSGVFVDLVGSFTPAMRETDDEVVRRCRIFVDTFAGALAEAGDLIDPLARGVISRERIEGELADLVLGRVHGRASREELTLFKSVGSAIEDLAAAQLIVTAATRGSLPAVSLS
jgi:alanine dehydrogenase